MTSPLIIIDSIKWQDWRATNGVRYVTPICLQHDIRLEPVLLYTSKYSGTRGNYRVARSSDESVELYCDEGSGHTVKIPREYGKQKTYVKNKIDSQAYKKMQVLNLDDSAVPVVDTKIKDKDNPYWIKAKITESKAGTRLIIWAGNREAKNKTQLFVEPEYRKLSFDQNDDHPLEVFSKVEVTFANNFKATIDKDVAV